MTNTETYPKRKNIRLQGYDYSQAGLYFVTLCTQGIVCLSGKVAEHKIYLNDVGKMVEKWYYNIEDKFNDKVCHDMIIMPNHMHFIIENIGCEHVGTDLRFCPHDTGEHIGSPLQYYI